LLQNSERRGITPQIYEVKRIRWADPARFIRLGWYSGVKIEPIPDFGKPVLFGTGDNCQRHNQNSCE